MPERSCCVFILPCPIGHVNTIVKIKLVLHMNLSKRLLELKETRSLLQKDISDATGISLRTYQRYEYGERKPDSDTLISLADYFDVSLDYLVGRSDDPKRY